MKPSKLITFQELLVSKSKKPWACFESDGFSEEGMGVAMHWNKAFIDTLHEQGIQGTTEQETLQLFFMFMASRISAGISGEDDSINPEATPNLTSEANTLIK